VHTPWELYGTREAALGAQDEDWLKRVSPRGWAILGRDLKIYERPAELKAYQRARVQVFLLPGEALAAELAHLVEVNLVQICTIAANRRPGTWLLTKGGPELYEITGKRRQRRS
jgi:hypothetical protein